jgi:hypothetical protein
MGWLCFVLNSYTVKRLREFSEFVERDLLFVDHVTFMGLETIGFARSNIVDIWIDPYDCMSDLEFSVLKLAKSGLRVSVYNLQLCLIPSSLMPFYRHSISDWKNELMDECGDSLGRLHCAGFFASKKLRHSKHLRPYKDFGSLAAQVGGGG